MVATAHRDKHHAIFQRMNKNNIKREVARLLTWGRARFNDFYRALLIFLAGFWIFGLGGGLFLFNS